MMWGTAWVSGFCSMKPRWRWYFFCRVSRLGLATGTKQPPVPILGDERQYGAEFEDEDNGLE